MAKPKLLSELSNKVPIERTINDKALSSDIDITINDLEGTLPTEKGGTGYSTIEDTTYSTARYRASALVSEETTPTTNGVINWIYE